MFFTFTSYAGELGKLGDLQTLQKHNHNQTTSQEFICIYELFRRTDT